ncbi:DEAD/DEAH box helicase family protein [Gammaproteobacteria bacterium]|nr:DEAD/DEAH box helicase family protein [Gammaproteobacteria bacterium]
MADIERHLRGPKENLGDHLFKPGFEECKLYRRQTAFFQPSVFKCWASSIEQIVENEIKLEILMAFSPSNSRILNLIHNLQTSKEKDSLIHEEANSLFLQCLGLAAGSEGFDKRNRLIRYLYAKGLLEIKLAFSYQPETDEYSLAHEKTGYFKKKDESIILFNGSMNESESALIRNGEHITVYQSTEKQDSEDIAYYKNDLDDKWNSEDEYTKTFTPSKDLMDKIKANSDVNSKFDAVAIAREIMHEEKDEAVKLLPKITEKDLRDYQNDVLMDWEESDRKGIINFSTGSGKTFTALFALKKHLEENEVALILVPSNLLQTQWKKELLKVIPEARDRLLLVGGEGKKWKDNLSLLTRPNGDGKPKVIIAVNNSASTPDFLKFFYQGSHLMVIADEVHRLGSHQFSKVFSIDSGARLGLSATPNRYGDPEGTQRIFDYFGSELPTKYSLKDAIGKALVPYRYYPTKSYLNEEELENWINISSDIRKATASCRRNSKDQIIPSKKLELLLFERAKITKEAACKIGIAADILKKEYENGQRWLVYCQSENQLEELYEMLIKNNLGFTFKYHSNMKVNSKRETLSHFISQGGILLSMKCLDEGVDIPSASHALIISSDQNPRQFIQRRGRVLRKDDNNNKRRAFIYDLVISIDSRQDDSFKMLVESELTRSLEFANTSENKHQSTSRITEIALDSGLSVESLKESIQAFEDE